MDERITLLIVIIIIAVMILFGTNVRYEAFGQEVASIDEPFGIIDIRNPHSGHICERTFGLWQPNHIALCN